MNEVAGDKPITKKKNFLILSILSFEKLILF